MEVGLVKYPKFRSLKIASRVLEIFGEIADISPLKDKWESIKNNKQYYCSDIEEVILVNIETLSRLADDVAFEDLKIEACKDCQAGILFSKKDSCDDGANNNNDGVADDPIVCWKYTTNGVCLRVDCEDYLITLDRQPETPQNPEEFFRSSFLNDFYS